MKPVQELEGRMQAILTRQQASQELWNSIVQEQNALFAEMRQYLKWQSEAAKLENTAQVQPSQLPMDMDVDMNDAPRLASPGPTRVETVQSGWASDSVDLDGPQQDAIFSEESGIHVGLGDYQSSNLARLTGRSLDTKMVTCPKCKDGCGNWIVGVCSVILSWDYFEPFILAVIFLNAVNIGWTIDRELREEDITLQDTIETIFMCIFIVEVAMRMIVKGCRSFRSPAIMFDFGLVVITGLTQILAPVVGAWDRSNTLLQQVLILRMMRLLRLARAVRLVATFRPLWKLAKGLSNCFTTMFSALVLIFITIYLFACIGAEFVAKLHRDDPDPEVSSLINLHFSSMPKILLTLMRFTTMDSTSSFYGPLVYRSPWLVLYFLPLFVIVAIAMMNLITALLVEDSLNSAKMDQEMKSVFAREKIKHLKPALRTLFQSIDVSGDGIIEVKEVVQSMRSGLKIPPELHDIVNPARMLDLFEALDVDNSGDLNEAEFVEGMCCVAVAEMPRETMQVLQLLRSLRREVRRTTRQPMMSRGLTGSLRPKGGLLPHANSGMGMEI